MRKLSFFSLLFFSSFFLLLLSLGCRPKAHERARVAVSIFPVYDIVRRVAGSDADVALVLPPGVSPAGWVPPDDAKEKVAGAKLLVSIGLGLDGWMDALAPAATPKARKLELGNRVPTITRDDGAIDPYVWMDPQRARLMTMAIAEDLARTDPSHAAAFRERAATLDAALAALDREIEVRTTALRSRTFATKGGSLGYYAERYGLHQMALQQAQDPQPTPLVTVDALGGASAAATYEDLIHQATAALESALH